MRTLRVEITEGAGSRVRLRMDDVKLTVHRPHPNPELDRRAVRRIASFLTDIGVVP